MEGHAVGELAEDGGRWRLFDHDGVDREILYRVEHRAPSRAWMNLLAPIGAARSCGVEPRLGHDHGGEGIARLLGCRLLAGG